MDSQAYFIRRARAGDERALGAMRAESSFERKGGDRRERDEHEAVCAAFFARELADPQSFLRSWVATVDGTIVGGASLAIVPTLPRYGSHTSGRDGRVRDVYVAPAFRKRGIARALMLEILQAAKAERVDRLSLGASAMGAPLYLSLGFAYKRDEMVFTGDD